MNNYIAPPHLCEIFSKIVDQIFANWSALKLAVEHSQGGPNSQQVARDCKNYVTEFCLSNNNIESENIQDVLDDLLDEEFDTICEDNSTKEIAMLLYNFRQLALQNNVAEMELQYNNLPKMSTDWLLTPVPQNKISLNDDDTSSSENESPMEEDPGWTTVKTYVTHIFW